MSSSDLTSVIRAAWDADAAIYDALPGHGLRSYEERAQLAVTLAQTFGGRRQRLLDVGAGTGALALLLAALGHEVMGVDLAPEMLDEARRKAAALGLAVTFVEGDAATLSLADGAMDGVVSRHLLWTLPDPPAALREWRRVTRPGGTVAVMDGWWADSSPGMRLRHAVAAPSRRRFAPRRHSHADYDALGHQLPLCGGATPEQAATLLRDAGLLEVHVRDLALLRRAEHAARPWYDRIDAPRVTWLAWGLVTRSS